MCPQPFPPPLSRSGGRGGDQTCSARVDTVVASPSRPRRTQPGTMSLLPQARGTMSLLSSSVSSTRSFVAPLGSSAGRFAEVGCRRSSTFSNPLSTRPARGLGAPECGVDGFGVPQVVRRQGSGRLRRPMCDWVSWAASASLVEAMIACVMAMFVPSLSPAHMREMYRCTAGYKTCASRKAVLAKDMHKQNSYLSLHTVQLWYSCTYAPLPVLLCKRRAIRDQSASGISTSVVFRSRSNLSSSNEIVEECD